MFLGYEKVELNDVVASQESSMSFLNLSRCVVESESNIHFYDSKELNIFFCFDQNR